MLINLNNIELFNIMRTAFTNLFPNRKMNILDFMKNKLIRLNIILMIFSFSVSQPLHTHEPTGISFYETTLKHYIFIENVNIDGIDATLANYDGESAPTGVFEELLNPINAGEFICDGSPLNNTDCSFLSDTTDVNGDPIIITADYLLENPTPCNISENSENLCAVNPDPEPDVIFIYFSRFGINVTCYYIYNERSWNNGLSSIINLYFFK